jgi:hypothetical protein
MDGEACRAVASVVPVDVPVAEVAEPEGEVAEPEGEVGAKNVAAAGAA